MQLNLKIVTPEKEIFNEAVDKIVVPSKEGELGILPHHINLMASIIPGELKITKNNKTTSLAVGEGLLQVAHDQVSILTDLAVEASDIDEKAAEEARKRAQQALADKTLSDEEYATTVAILDKSIAQLKIKRRHHPRSLKETETIS